MNAIMQRAEQDFSAVFGDQLAVLDLPEVCNDDLLDANRANFILLEGDFFSETSHSENIAVLKALDKPLRVAVAEWLDRGWTMEEALGELSPTSEEGTKSLAYSLAYAITKCRPSAVFDRYERAVAERMRREQAKEGA